MKSIIALLVLGVVFAGPVHAQDATKDATAAYAAWDEAFNSHDPVVLSSSYADDALFLAPDHVVRKGPDNVKEFFGGLFKNGVTGHKLTLIEAGGDGNLVYATAKWKAQAKGSDGAMSEIGGIGTHIFERQQDGALKLKLHTFN